MDECNLFIFIFNLICILSLVHGGQDSGNTCARIVQKSVIYDCVISTECSSLNILSQFHKAVLCGKDEGSGSPKICCPRNSQRFRRQAQPASKKDPYYIAQQKCNEYSAARYVEKVILPNLPSQKNYTLRTLDCVKAQPLIVKGVLAKLKEFPHMALIGYNDRSDKPNDTNWACGGTLISDRYVLTAAHCQWAGNVEARWVRLGELVVNDDTDSAKPRDIRIMKRIPHPQYTSSSVYFDIMLLKLREVVQFTPHMRPICLYTSPVIAAALNNKALITGWGVTGTGEQNSEALLKAKIEFADDSECTNTYREDRKMVKGYDPATMICAGDKEIGRGTCAGDSGGPLQVPVPDWTCMYSQVGITSYGSFFCGQKNMPSVYTKISAYIPWIQSIVWP